MSAVLTNQNIATPKKQRSQHVPPEKNHDETCLRTRSSRRFVMRKSNFKLVMDLPESGWHDSQLEIWARPYVLQACGTTTYEELLTIVVPWSSKSLPPSRDYKRGNAFGSYFEKR